MITVFGSINLDLIFPMDRLPGPGETMLGTDVLMQPGGKGANQAVAAALDGANVAMVGAVGMDGLAETALSGLVAAGVDLSRVIRVDSTTGCAAIATDAVGRNLIIGGSGANQATRAAQLEDALLFAGHTVLMQVEVPVRELEHLVARSHGARLILNLAPTRSLSLDLYRALDILVVNEHEAAWLATDLGVASDAASLHSQLGCIVVRTMGGEGAEWAGEGAGCIPAFHIDAVDTTAAGDCFTGVMAAALDRGDALPSALRRASAAAALCCTRRGSQISLPRAAETDAFLV